MRKTSGMDDVVVGPILERDGERLRVGAGSTVFLRHGATCNLPVGTLVRVTFTQRDGRKEVETIQPLPEVR